MKITDNIIKETKKFLGEDGISFFKEMISEHGEVSPVFNEGGIPHAVHFQEGMQIRNFLRSVPDCSEWNAHDLDNNWIKIIQEVLDEEN